MNVIVECGYVFFATHKLKSFYECGFYGLFALWCFFSRRFSWKRDHCFSIIGFICSEKFCWAIYRCYGANIYVFNCLGLLQLFEFGHKNISIFKIWINLNEFGRIFFFSQTILTKLAPISFFLSRSILLIGSMPLLND